MLAALTRAARLGWQGIGQGRRQALLGALCGLGSGGGVPGTKQGYVVGGFLHLAFLVSVVDRVRQIEPCEVACRFTLILNA
ncbi:MAG: hypothetical protein AB7E55_30110 [Pigmentiphaga sp.]